MANSRMLWLMVLSMFLLSACETPPTKKQTGTVIGGILGGVLGSQVGKGNGRTAAIILGSIAGGFAGSYIGGEMDEADRLRQQRALEYTPTHQATSWVNPDTQARYEVTPTRNYSSHSGQPCRDYTTTIYIDGQAERAKGTACRDRNGQWNIN